MRRLNMILIAGTLCFSLGYIANDIVGETGVKLTGIALAFPGSPITQTNSSGLRERSLRPGA